MRIDKVFGVLSAIFLIASAVWYGALIYSNSIQPAVATFILATVVLLISEWTYWSKKGASLFGNIALHAGAINVVIVTTILIARRIYDGNFVADFNNFQYGCLIASMAILIAWRLSKRHAVSYCLIQLVAVVAYLPTIERVWTANTQTESNVLWVAILVSSLFAVWPTIRRFREDHSDWLGLVYLGRTIPSNLIVVYLVAAKTAGWAPF